MLVLLVTVSSIEPRPRFLLADNPPLPIEPELALAVLLDEGNCNNEACASRARYQHCRKWMFWVFSLHPERAIYGTYLI